MPPGPGKYGARAEKLLREVNGTLVCVITLGGEAGPAFDVAAADPLALLRLPAILRDVARHVEDDLRKGIL